MQLLGRSKKIAVCWNILLRAWAYVSLNLNLLARESLDGGNFNLRAFNTRLFNE